MENNESVMDQKTARASGAVHRPSDAAAPEAASPPGPSSPSNQSIPELPASPLQPGTPQAGPHQAKPPPYSTPSQHSIQEPRGSRATVPRYPGLPPIDYRQYSPPMFSLSADTTTINSKATYLSENAQALASLLRTLATVPPKPLIQVTGNRGRKIDFSIKMNLMPLIIPEDPAERMDYLRTIKKDEMGYRGAGEPSLRPDAGDGSLEAWCQRFVQDQSSIKTFSLERVVANLDTEWLEGQLRSLVSATDYKGVVTVTFPVTHAKVIIQNPDKVNKFFTSVSALFTGKSRYETVKSVWPFASAQNGAHGRRCLVQSEKTWWEEWRDPIKFAIATKRHGWVTNEDKLECIMDSKGKGLSIVDWGPDF